MDYEENKKCRAIFCAGEITWIELFIVFMVLILPALVFDGYELEYIVVVFFGVYFLSKLVMKYDKPGALRVTTRAEINEHMHKIAIAALEEEKNLTAKGKPSHQRKLE